MQETEQVPTIDLVRDLRALGVNVPQDALTRSGTLGPMLPAHTGVRDRNVPASEVLKRGHTATTLQKVKKSSQLTKEIDDLIKQTTETGISVSSIVPLAMQLMQIVGKVKELGGHEKKELVITSLKIILERAIPETLDVIKPFFIDLVDPTINALIDVEKGKLRFNPKVVQGVKRVGQAIKNALTCKCCKNSSDDN